MMDESTRLAYLETMGVTQWQPIGQETLASEEPEFQAEPVQAKTPSQPEKPPVQIAKVEPSEVQAETDSQTKLTGLKLITPVSQNGLLVILPMERSELAPEARQLVSKMLNSIHFLPKETAFAVTSESVEDTLELTGVRVMLCLGNEGGRHLVRQSGARTLAGTDTLEVMNKKVVCSWHPEELISHPEHKKQAWQHLKLLVELHQQER